MDNLFQLEQDYALVAGSLVAIFLLYLLSSIAKTSKIKRPPEAGGAWPILGHFNLFGGSSDLPHVALAAMAEKYGPIFTVRLGMHRLLIVNGPNIAKEIFTTHDSIVSSRPRYLAAKVLGYDYAMFGFAPYGPYWREMRKIVALELLSSRGLDRLKNVRASEIEGSVKSMHEVWRARKDGEGKAAVEMKKWFGELNMNVVLRMVVGKRYSGAASVEEEEEMGRCREVMRDFFRFLGAFVAADMVPFLGWLDFGGHAKDMKRVAREIDGMAGKWLEEHRRRRDSGEVCGGKDFMDEMMTAVETGRLPDFDRDTIIKSACMVLIASSADTTTIMLTWTLSLLLNNRHVLQKVQEELDEHVGKDRQVNESDISNLIYLQAIVKETLRLYPAGPLGGTRVFSEDCIVAGYYVPKGTWLMINMWKLQQDPQIWSNPSEFRPERFLNGSHKDVDVKGTHFELIPFGAGRRSCPGIAFGLQMLHMILATLLHNFDISTPNQARVDMTESAGLTNAKASPLEVLITPRLSSTI